jgi:hypothetical protein
MKASDIDDISKYVLKNKHLLNLNTLVFESFVTTILIT